MRERVLTFQTGSRKHRQQSRMILQRVTNEQLWKTKVGIKLFRSHHPAGRARDVSIDSVVHFWVALRQDNWGHPLSKITVVATNFLRSSPKWLSYPSFATFHQKVLTCLWTEWMSLLNICSFHHLPLLADEARLTSTFDQNVGFLQVAIWGAFVEISCTVLGIQGCGEESLFWCVHLSQRERPANRFWKKQTTKGRFF